MCVCVGGGGICVCVCGFRFVGSFVCIVLGGILVVDFVRGFLNYCFS